MTDATSPHASIGLRGRLFLLLLAASAMLISLVAWNFVGDRDDHIKAATAELLGQARVIAARQQAIVARADAILNGLMLSPELRPGASTDICAQFLSTRLKLQQEFIQAGRTLPNGELACAAIPPSGRVSYADRSWFQAAVKSRGMVVSEVLKGRILPTPVIVFAKAMRDETGRATGVLFLSLDLTWLHRELAASRLADRVRLVVVDAKGIMAVRHPDPEGWAGKGVANLRLLQRIEAAGGEGALEENELTGEPRLFAFTKLLETISGPMHIWLAVPREVIEAPALRAALLRLGAMLALLLGMLGLLVWGGNRLVIGPLLVMARSVTHFGAGDFAARTGLPHSDDEVGLLARTLDETASAIEDKERRLADANQALHDSEERFRVLASSAPDGIVLIDGTGTIVFWNAAAERLFGYTAEEALGRELHRLIVPPQHRHAAAAGMTHFLGSGEGPMIGASAEFETLRKDGTTFMAEHSISAMRLHGAWHAMGVVRDTTQRRELQHSMERQLDELRRFQDVALGRELRMKALVEENERLEARLAELARRPGTDPSDDRHGQ